MKRELVTESKRKSWVTPNNIRRVDNFLGIGGSVLMVRIVVKVEGKLHGYVAWGDAGHPKAAKMVQDYVLTYLDPECLCVSGVHPYCKVHKSEYY